MMDRNRILVVDITTPWIWSLMEALPQPWIAERCGPVTVGLSLRRWREVNRRPDHVAVPGWTKLFRLSTAILARRIGQRLQSARPRALLHSTPWTAGLLDRFPEIAHIYRPHDFFGGYAWNQKRSDQLERKLVAECKLVAPLSAAQTEDLRKLNPSTIHRVPDGVSASFVTKLRAPTVRRPDDLPDDGRPIVGCTGQMNPSYDVELMEELASALPEVWFVYIGPLLEDVFTHLFSRSKNMLWLGARPHDRLPEYLRHFTVCFCPLRMNFVNDRRSPLRLYDYLASERPILSTAIASAKELQPHVTVGASAAELVSAYRQMESNHFTVDVPTRRAFVDTQTWPRRGEVLAELIEKYCP